MNFGAHISSAGGLHMAPARAREFGGTVFQMFSRPPQGGKPKPITSVEITSFNQAMKEAEMKDFYIHAPYFVNLASTDSRIYKSSIGILREELERGSLLGCRGMMFHPGSAKGSTKEEALLRVVAGINEILKGYTGKCLLLIENSAGAGEIVGDSFEDLAFFIESAKESKKIGICLDTQHAFASGYDLRTKDAVKDTLHKFDQIVGLENLVVIHTNDSKIPFEGRKDRHEHLGKGHIGSEGFCALVKHEALKDMDFILETPQNETRPEDLSLLEGCK